MTLKSVLGFILKICLYLVVFLGGVVYSYMQRHSPTRPDPASGHVFPVSSPRSRRLQKKPLYLTSPERSLYHASFIVIFVGTFGILGHLFLIKKRRFTASQG